MTSSEKTPRTAPVAASAPFSAGPSVRELTIRSGLIASGSASQPIIGQAPASPAQSESGRTTKAPRTSTQ